MALHQLYQQLKPQSWKLIDGHLSQSPRHKNSGHEMPGRSFSGGGRSQKALA